MAHKDIYSVIEDLLEADMTKKDDIDNPQDKMAEEDEMEEAKEVSNQSADAATAKPKADNQSADDQGVLGSEKGAAMDAGGDKDVGGSKGDNPSDASADTQGVEGSKTGAAQDAGGDKDVGNIDGKNAKPSDASSEVEADEGPHDQSKSNIGEESDEEEMSEADEEEMSEADEDDMEEAVVADKEGGVANDAQRPPEEKGDNAPKDTGKDVDSGAKEGPHDQSSDAHDTATKANPKTTVSEEDEEEMEEKSAADVRAATKARIAKLRGEEADDLEEADVSNVMKAAEMYKADEDCTYEMAAEKYGCSAEEVKACCEMDMEEVKGLDKDNDGDHDMDDHKMEEGEMPDALKKNAEKMKQKHAESADEDEMEEELVGGQKKLDKDKDGDIDASDLAKVRKDGVDEEADEEEMNEEFKQRASVIFETAVNEKVGIVREELEKAYEDKLEEVKIEMNEKVSEYVDYAVQEWMSENALEIQYSLRTEIAENFIRGLKGLFEDNYIEIPEEEVSVVDELTEAVESYKEQIEESTEELIALKEEILSMKRTEIVDEIAEDLTETQKIRLEKLSESVEADDIDEFRFKMEELKEGYFDPSSEQPLLGDLTEEVYGGVYLEEDDSTVSQYAKFLSKTVLK